VIVVDRVLGNRHEDARLAERCIAAHRAGRLEAVALHPSLAQRRRLRVVSDAGTEIGVALGEGGHLCDGDVLVDEEGGRVVVVALPEPETVRLRCDAALCTEAAFHAGIRLGHLLGMQHWDYHWAESGCVVTVTDRPFVEAVLRTHPVDGVSYEFRSSSPGAGGGP